MNMALTLTIYQFAKKNNSTAQPPANAQSRQYSGLLIDDTNVVNPMIRLLYVTNTSYPVNYNYAYIQDLGRYYFIDSWKWTAEGWVASMTVDVLATYKTQIGAMNLYIERADNAYDGRIIDTFYPVMTEVGSNIGHVSWQSPFVPSVHQGCFVIGVVSANGDYGSIAYYALSFSAMRNLCAALLNDNILAGFSSTDASLALQKAMIDPLSFIKSCVFIPMDPTAVGGTAENVKVWTWQPNVIGYRLDSANPSTAISAIINLSDHPQKATRGVYMNGEPFTLNEIYIPTAGKIDLDTSITLNHPFLNIVSIFDPRTGEGRVRVYAGTSLQDANYILGELPIFMGVPIQLSQVVADNITMAAGTFAGYVNEFTRKLGLGDAFKSTGSGLINQPHPSSSGTQGSIANLFRNIDFQQIFYYAVAEDRAHNGRPYCQITTPAAIPNGGYMIAQHAEIEISTALSDEIRMLADYLTGGFFYE